MNHKRLETQFDEERSRFEAAFEHAATAMALVDLDGRFTRVNERFCRLLGFTNEEFLQKTFVEITHPEDIPLSVAGRDRLFAGDDGSFTTEKRYLRKDGQTIWVHVTVAVVRDAGRKPSGYVTYILDITERRKTENALRESEARLRQLVDNISEVFYLVSPDGSKVHYVSPAYERIWGVPCESAYKSTFSWNEMMHPDDRTRIFDELKMLDPAIPYSLQYRIIRADGEQRWIRARNFPVKDDHDKVIYLAGLAEDVTAITKANEAVKKSEQEFRQAQKLEAIGRLAGGVAHDFNNLLTAIMGYAALLIPTFEKDDPRRDDLSEIQKTSERAAGLTRQLLAFSRRQILAPKIFELNALILDTSKMLGRLIGEDIRLVISPKSNSGLVHADPGQLEQVLMNLVVNSRDAMPRGGIITIITQDEEIDEDSAGRAKPGRYVVLSVSDTGCGISRENMTRIFEPFFTTKTNDKGTGLGLSTVHGIVAQSGGFIRVQSEEGKGATFQVFLPRVEGAPQKSADGPARSNWPSGSETILIVEDETPVRRLASRVLQKCGYNVLEADSGKTAIELANRRTTSIDLILADVVMPELDGQRTVETILGSHPESKALYMSGYTDEAIVNHGMLNPGTNFLPKPFPLENLACKVREVLDARMPAA